MSIPMQNLIGLKFQNLSGLKFQNLGVVFGGDVDTQGASIEAIDKSTHETTNINSLQNLGNVEFKGKVNTHGGNVTALDESTDTTHTENTCSGLFCLNNLQRRRPMILLV